MILVQNQGPSRGSSPSRNQGGGSSGGGEGGAHHSASSFNHHHQHYAAFPSSFQLPSNEHDNNPTLVNILAPTPITPVEGMEGGPSSILDYTPTNELPNSSFLPSSSSSVSPTNQGAGGPFSMDSSDLSGSPFSLNNFDASDLFRNLLDGSGGQQLSSPGLSPFANDDSSFLDLGTLQSTMDMDTGAINPYDFDPTLGGGATSDSEGYISSAASTDGSSMRMGPYFASRKRPSEDASSGSAYPGGLGAGASKPRKPRSIRAGSVGRSSSKQDLPTAFGSLGGQSAGEFPPSSSSSTVPPQAKRRKSFSITSPDSSNSPPSPSSTSNLSATSGAGGGGGGPLDGPLRRTNSNPHPASFSFAQPTPAQNAFFLPRSQSNSPAQPIPQTTHSRNPSPSSSSSLYAQRPQPFPSSSVPNHIPTSSSHSFTPSFNQLRSRPNSSAASSSTSAYSSSTTNGNGYHPKSPSSSAASSSGAPSLGLNPVVETSLEWVPSKPRIRKSIRRRLEKKRDEPQRMVHVLEGRPPPAVEVNLPKSSRSGSKSKKGKGRDLGGVTAGEESGTEGGTRRKSSSASSSNNFGPSSSRKIRTGSVSSMDVPSSKLGRPAAKGKGKPKKSGAATGESDVDSSGGEEDDEEDGEAKMERMMKSFEHLGTELPPRVYEGGVSPLMPERKKGKIPGSAMDRLPAIDARFAALETGIESYLKAVARRSLQNSMLPGLDFPSLDIQQIWDDLGGKGIYQPRPAYSYHDEDEADDEQEY